MITLVEIMITIVAMFMALERGNGFDEEKVNALKVE